MRIHLKLRPLSPVVLPRTYRTSIQGLLYHRLSDSDPTYAAALHDEGFRAKDSGRARFKFFTFSSLLTHERREIRYKAEKQGFSCHPDDLFSLFFSSPQEDFFRVILQGFFQAYFENRRPLDLAGGRFAIEAMDLEPTPDFQTDTAYRFRCIGGGFVAREAPGILPDGKTYLTLEHQERFERAPRKNLRMKLETVSPEKSDLADALALSLLPSPRIPLAQQSYGYRFRHGSKEQIVVGTPCSLLLQGDPSCLAMAWSSGIGEKNSQGMGMIDLEPPSHPQPRHLE